MRSDRADRVVAGLGVARAVRQEDAVGLQREHRRRRRLRRDDGDAAAALGEQAQDVVLDAEIVGDDVKARRCRASRSPPRAPMCPTSTRTASCSSRPCARSRPAIDGRRPRARDGVRHLGVADRRRREQAAVLRAPLAQDARELARVDVGDADDVVRREIRAEVAGRRGSSRRCAADRGSRDPPRTGWRDSTSSGLTPTLPTCG